MKLHTLIRCWTLKTMESCRLFLLKFKVLGYKNFPALSPYLDWEEERCTLFLCLLFHFYKELCALNRYKTFFFFSFSLVLPIGDFQLRIKILFSTAFCLRKLLFDHIWYYPFQTSPLNNCQCGLAPKSLSSPRALHHQGLLYFWTISPAPRALNNICTLRPTFPSPCAVPQCFLLFWPLPLQGSSLFYAIYCENKIIFPEKPSGPTQICCHCGKNPQAWLPKAQSPELLQLLFLFSPPCWISHQILPHFLTIEIK